MNGKKIDVGCYYFPNYHGCDERNAKIHGGGWSEWELVKAAKPRFEGHHQPLKPLWGYEDESRSEVMRYKIENAMKYGIDFFIMDYYHYDDGPFLSHCLDDGLLPAITGTEFKFALMWANHDWTDIHPRSYWHKPDLLYKGAVNLESFVKITNHIIEHYFKHPNYRCKNGKPYFSIYDIHSLLKGLGGFAEVKKALADFRARVIAAGFAGLELNAIVWGRPILPGEKGDISLYDAIKELGFDSSTSYCWVHHCDLMYDRPATPYPGIFSQYMAKWDEIQEKSTIPYYPNISMGWDPSPRCAPTDRWGWRGSYPYSPTIKDNTPEQFTAALKSIRGKMENLGTDLLTVYCWNEWTEGSYLEPELKYGYAYLEAFRNVFPENVKWGKKDGVVRIASYNIRSCHGMDYSYDPERSARAISTMNPDSIGIQEIRIYQRRENDENQPAIVERCTGMKTYFGEAMYFEIDHFKYGIALMSKYPSELIDVVKLPRKPDTEQRVAIVAKIHHDLGDYYHVNTHLSYEDDEISLKQMQAILDYMQKNNYFPAVLTGDMNSVPTAPSILELDKRHWAVADKSHLTAPANEPTMQIDYIAWYPQEAFKLKRFERVMDRLTSDHCPIVADLIPQK